MTSRLRAAALCALALPTAAPALPLTEAFLDAVAAGAYLAPAPAEAVREPLVRIAPDARGPGGAPSGADRPSPRAISNALSVPALVRTDPAPLSNFATGWAQFMMSHDLARSPADADRVLDIPVAADDPVAREVDGVPVMRQRRSSIDPATGEPFSDVTPWLDGSTVYGSTAARAAQLREPGEGGLLRVADDGGLMIVHGRRYAGDERADENLVLESIHELMMKEHNRLAREIADGCAAGGLACSGDAIYGAARAVNVAVQQRILFEEFAPAFLGTSDFASLVPDAALLDGPGIVLNEFTAAAGRIGHTKVPARVEVALPGGPRTGAAIEDCIFDRCIGDQPLDARIYGALTQPSEPVDTVVTPGLRNALLETPGEDILIDLLATNINRGRDHGLSDYLAVRRALGLAAAPAAALLPAEVLAIYDDPDEIDLLVGIFGESPLAGSQLGETGSALWALQLERLRRDPDFYTSLAGDPLGLMLGDWGMADVIAANTSLTRAQASDPFRAPAAVPAPPALAAMGLGLLGLAALRRRTGGRARAPDGRARRA